MFGIKEAIQYTGCDAYSMNAVILPTVTNIILFMLVVYPYANIDYNAIYHADWNHPFLIFTTILGFIVLYFIWSSIARMISKKLVVPITFGKCYNKLPTTLMLFAPNKFQKSKGYRDDILNSIMQDFNKTVKVKRTQIPTDEQAIVVSDIVGLIRKKVQQLPENKVYLIRNIRYGLIRNFIGGAIFAIALEGICFLLLGSITQSQWILYFVQIGLLLTSWAYLPFCAKEYAIELYDNYLNLKR